MRFVVTFWCLKDDTDEYNDIQKVIYFFCLDNMETSRSWAWTLRSVEQLRYSIKLIYVVNIHVMRVCKFYTEGNQTNNIMKILFEPIDGILHKQAWFIGTDLSSSQLLVLSRETFVVALEVVCSFRNNKVRCTSHTIGLLIGEVNEISLVISEVTRVLILGSSDVEVRTYCK